jgi:hypothetical protein
LSAALSLSLAFVALSAAPESVEAEDTTQAPTARVLFVRIASDPDSALLSINGIRKGTTPLLVADTANEVLTVSVSRDGYLDSEVQIRPSSQDTMQILIRLKRTFPTLSVFSNCAGSPIRIDDSTVSTGTLLGFQTSIGAHRICVQNDSLGRSLVLTPFLSEPVRYFVKADFRMVVPARLAGAFFLPGVDQMSDGEYVKGSVLLAATVAFGYLAFDSHSQYTDRLRAYDAAMTSYLGAQTDVLATLLHEDLLLRKTDLDKAYVRRTVYFTLFAGSYLYGLVDAMLHHLLGDLISVVPLRDIPGLPFPKEAKGIEIHARF